MRNDFKKKILLFLLNNPKTDLTKYKIAKMIGCTPSWVIMLFKQLENEKILKNGKVFDFKKLLEKYMESFKQFKAVYFYVPNVRDLIRESNKQKLDYALTTYFGESVMQGFLFPSKFEIYIDKNDLEKWKKIITEEVNGGIGRGNVTLFLSSKEFLENKTKIKGLNVINLPQLIVDLFNEGHVCVQAAKMLLEKIVVN